MATIKSSAENLTLNADGSGNDIIIQSNGSTLVTVDGATGAVGVGTTSPARTLHVKSGTTNVVAKFESTDAIAAVEFVDSGGSAEIGNSGNDVVFFPAGVEKLRIQSGGGISFNGDTAAANALDDYEEGTFTPTIYGAGGNSATFTTSRADYTKIGRLVTLMIYMHSINLGAITSGSYILMSGLPFTSDGYGDFTISYRSGGWDGTSIVGGYTQSGQPYAYFMNGVGAEAQQSGAYSMSRMMATITYITS